MGACIKHFHSAAVRAAPGFTDLITTVNLVLQRRQGHMCLIKSQAATEWESCTLSTLHKLERSTRFETTGLQFVLFAVFRNVMMVHYLGGVNRLLFQILALHPSSIPNTEHRQATPAIMLSPWMLQERLMH